jgi:hypothetical protein
MPLTMPNTNGLMKEGKWIWTTLKSGDRVQCWMAKGTYVERSEFELEQLAKIGHFVLEHPAPKSIAGVTFDWGSPPKD